MNEHEAVYREIVDQEQQARLKRARDAARRIPLPDEAEIVFSVDLNATLTRDQQEMFGMYDYWRGLCPQCEAEGVIRDWPAYNTSRCDCVRVCVTHKRCWWSNDEAEGAGDSQWEWTVNRFWIEANFDS